MCSVSGAERCALPNGPIPLKGKPASSFYRHKEGRCTCTGDRGSRRLPPESRGCSDRALWEVHCGVWRRSWQSSWASFLIPSHRTNGYLAANSRSWSSSKRANSYSENETGFTRYEKEKRTMGLTRTNSVPI